MIRIAIGVLMALAACGRVGFSSREGGGDAAIDAAIDSPPCTASEWSPTITRLVNISVDGVDDWEPAVSPDGLMIVFASYRSGTGDSELYYSIRANPDDDFPTPTPIPVFGAVPGIDVFGPAWSIDGKTLYFTGGMPREVDYLGNGQFGTPRASGLPGDSVVFVTPDDIYSTLGSVINDYDLEHWTRSGTTWSKQPLPAAYNRIGALMGDGWPTFDHARRTLYFEHEENDGVIVRAALDAAGNLPPMFERLDQLGSDLGDPDLSRDGLRMYVGSRRRQGTDNDIYMFERSCL